MSNGFVVPLRRRRDLEDLGWDSRQIARALKAGHLIAVRRGVFARASELRDLKIEEQVVLRARSYGAVATSRPIFAGRTAAALHRLPLVVDDGRLHVCSSENRPGSASDVVRHRGDLGADDITEIDGIACTSLVRTVADVARWESRESAVSVADAGLRAMAWTPPGTYDLVKAEMFRESAIDALDVSPRGRSRGRRVLEFADGRAQRPGESISRIRLDELGFASPSLQVAVDGPRGKTYWLDFGLDQANAWGEFDGKVKYRELADASERSSREIVEAEKRREDWIRGTTGRTVVRWGWEHIGDAAALGRRLAAFGVRPGPRS
ncbi:hypothetical protein QE430_001388 [Microbacterium testaceum]|uniref:type IV toxin-antitoxin system AbiEi family antitoxin domain-containing protein n=1 Tax=Microbacterium testaceum TaxID=2033 RepID=UPI002789E4C9|nr:type IV toxin-antitoxin system AbiEi family antitoxin domain-containing protein [Microbacterium testaceum]MDQ1173081.1 hypothetical protein [Microbacterium testaceum]